MTVLFSSFPFLPPITNVELSFICLQNVRIVNLSGKNLNLHYNSGCFRNLIHLPFKELTVLLTFKLNHLKNYYKICEKKRINSFNIDV